MKSCPLAPTPWRWIAWQRPGQLGDCSGKVCVKLMSHILANEKFIAQ